LQKERELGLQYGYNSANREDTQEHEVGMGATSYEQKVALKGMDHNFSDEQATNKYAQTVALKGMDHNFSGEQATNKYAQTVALKGMNHNFSDEQATNKYAQAVALKGMDHNFSDEQATNKYAQEIAKLGMKHKHAVDLQTQTTLVALYENNAHVGHKYLSGFNKEVSDASEIVYSESYKDYIAAQSGSGAPPLTAIATETEWGRDKAALTAAVSKNVKELRGGLYGAKIGLDYNVSAAEVVSLIASAPIDAQGNASFYVPIVKRRALKGYYDSYSEAIGRAGSRLKSADALANLPEDQRKDWESLNAEMQKTQRRLAKKFLHTTGIPFSTQGLPAIWSK
jgi:hypothetical protein